MIWLEKSKSETEIFRNTRRPESRQMTTVTREMSI